MSPVPVICNISAIAAAAAASSAKPKLSAADNLTSLCCGVNCDRQNLKPNEEND